MRAFRYPQAGGEGGLTCYNGLAHIMVAGLTGGGNAAAGDVPPRDV
ncbi:MAG: hypothetical protein ACQSGP_21775 [Frankia sp.]